MRLIGGLGVLFVALVLATAVVAAHLGRTDSSGGHTCRTNCSSGGLSTGQYHFHGGSSSSGSTGGSSSTTGGSSTDGSPSTIESGSSSPSSGTSESAATRDAPTFERVPIPGETYVIKAGDTLSAIASRFGLTVDELQELNPIISNPSEIATGQSIVLRESVATSDGANEEESMSAEPSAADESVEDEADAAKPTDEPNDDAQPNAAVADDDTSPVPAPEGPRDDDDDGGVGGAIGAIVVLGGLGAGAVWFWRRRFA